MQTHLVMFATDNFKQSGHTLVTSAHTFGINVIHRFSKEDLKRTTFYKEHKNILHQPRGAGYWLWKPYLIRTVLDRADEGDVVIYSDAGIEIIADLDPVVQICKARGVLLFTCGGHKNRAWTKRDCFVLMNADEARYWGGEQCLASFQLYKASRESVEFVNELLAYCRDERILTDIPNSMGKANFDDFKDHRHDQPVLSILAIRHNIVLYRDPTQWGNHLKPAAFRRKGEFLVSPYVADPMDSPYPTLLNHHRKSALTIRRVIRKLKSFL